MRIFPRNFASLAIGILFISFTTFASAATLLPPEEVEALKEIGKTLGKTGWDFSVDPCTFSTDNPNIDGFEDSVTCNPCNDTVCHITRIALKSQDLPGTLPPELARLTHLQDIDLTRNYLSGTIPPEWGSLKLVNISLLGNRLTGPIPIEFGNISTLANLTVEFNQLSGPIPAELGSLPLLEKLTGYHRKNILSEFEEHCMRKSTSAPMGTTIIQRADVPLHDAITNDAMPHLHVIHIVVLVDLLKLYIDSVDCGGTTQWVAQVAKCNFIPPGMANSCDLKHEKTFDISCHIHLPSTNLAFSCFILYQV